MIVCICKAVSDKHIRRAATEGVTSLRELSRELGVGTCCGKCVPQAREVLSSAVPAEPTALPALMSMQVAPAWPGTDARPNAPENRTQKQLKAFLCQALRLDTLDHAH